MHSTKIVCNISIAATVRIYLNVIKIVEYIEYFSYLNFCFNEKWADGIYYETKNKKL